MPIADENSRPTSALTKNVLDGKNTGIAQAAKRSTLGDISNTVINPAQSREVAAKKAKNAVPSAKNNVFPTRTTRSSTAAKQLSATPQAVESSPDCMIVETPSFSSRLSSAAVAEPVPAPDPIAAARCQISLMDEDDRGNAQIPVEYINEIFSYLLTLEKQHSVPSNYMQTVQTDVNEKMRAILIDWLVEVHLKFKLVPETLFLTVSILDRYLAIVPVQRGNLQLVGVASMLLAAKFEEIYAPEVRDFEYICDKAYSREQILEMEGTILAKLQFNLSVPQALVYMPRFFKVCGITRKDTECMASYFLELTLQDYRFLKYMPSMAASAAVYLAMKHSMVHMNAWGPMMTALTSYSEQAIAQCAKEMEENAKIAHQRSLTAVFKKYGSSKFHEVAKNIVWD